MGIQQINIKIKKFQEQDWTQVWPVIEAVFRAGETYVFDPDIVEEPAYNVWVKVPLETYVAVDHNNEILGTYYIKPNQPELGAHVCNCGYIVTEEARGQGIASLMCQHSQKRALELNFKAMQYNLVVATNKGAIALWKKLGFQIIGVLPKAFKSKILGYVDALVMYKRLK
jgi:RimJ/RimL family protein N-acetyltransferase